MILELILIALGLVIYAGIFLLIYWDEDYNLIAWIFYIIIFGALFIYLLRLDFYMIFISPIVYGVGILGLTLAEVWRRDRDG